MSTIAENSPSVNYSSLRSAAGFVLPPVVKKARLRRRFAPSSAAPLFRFSPVRHVYHSRPVDRHEIAYAKWAAREGSSWLRQRSGEDGLVKCDISDRASKISITLFADMVKVKRTGGDNRGGGGVRDKIRGFSHRSRRGMDEAMAKTHDLDSKPGLFATLTYPDEFSSDHERWHRDLNTFIKRLKRLYPDVGGFWRLELKIRQSGTNYGVYAPHFHILIFRDKKLKGNQLNWLRKWISLAWYEVVGSGSLDHLRAGTNVRTIHNRAHAMRYCAKYASKESTESFAVGRRWGCFGVLDRSPMWSAAVTRSAFYTFKRYAVRLLKSRGRRYASKLAASSPLGGFMVFGLGGQSRECKNLFDSTGYALLIDAVYLSRQPSQIQF